MSIKWQQIATYSSGSVISVFILLALLTNLVGMSGGFPNGSFHDGDQVCTDCFSEIRVKSSYWNIKVEHAGDKPTVFKKTPTSQVLYVNLDKISELVETNPPVKVDILVPASASSSELRHPKYGYLRKLKDGDYLIKRNTNANPNPSRIILHAQKDIKTSIEWRFDLEYYLMEDITIK